MKNIEVQRTESYELGIWAGTESMEKHFREKAGKSFSLGQKQAANILLEIAEEIGEKAKQLRKDHDKKYPK